MFLKWSTAMGGGRPTAASRPKQPRTSAVDSCLTATRTAPAARSGRRHAQLVVVRPRPQRPRRFQVLQRPRRFRLLQGFAQKGVLSAIAVRLERVRQNHASSGGVGVATFAGMRWGPVARTSRQDARVGLAGNPYVTASAPSARRRRRASMVRPPAILFTAGLRPLRSLPRSARPLRSLPGRVAPVGPRSRSTPAALFRSVDAPTR